MGRRGNQRDGGLLVIIIVVRDVGPGAVGGAILRNRGLITAMKAVHPSVLVFETARDSCGGGCDDCASAPVSGMPDPYPRDYCARTGRRLAAAIRQYDVRAVFITELRLHRYVDVVIGAGVPSIAMDMHDAESHLREDTAAHPLAVHLGADEVDPSSIRAIERSVSERSRLITFVSPVDETRFRSRHSPALTRVIPNSVDTSAWPVAGLDDAVADPPDLLFLGHLCHFPNVEAIDRLLGQIFPAVNAAFPGATLTIAGRLPAGVRPHWSCGEGVTLIANPADTGPLFRRKILVVPLMLGGGTRLKLLEAFAAGAPVISTEKGAEGLAVTPGIHYLSAGAEPLSYVKRIRWLVDNPVEGRAIRATARRLVCDLYSWTAIEPAVAEVVELLLSGGTGKLIAAHREVAEPRLKEAQRLGLRETISHQDLPLNVFHPSISRA